MAAPLPNEIREIISENLAAGMTHQDIADDLGISRSTVTKLAAHIGRYGTFFPKKPTGRPPTLDERDLEIVEEIITQNPGKNLTEYSELISKATGKRKLGKSNIHVILRRLGCTFKKTVKTATEKETIENEKKELST